MSDEFWKAFWTALPPTMMAAGALWQGYKTHKSVNSKLDKWLAVEREQGQRDGHAQGMKDEKANPTK